MTNTNSTDSNSNTTQVATNSVYPEETNDIINWLENNIDWNLIAAASIWLFLSFTFIYVLI